MVSDSFPSSDGTDESATPEPQEYVIAVAVPEPPVARAAPPRLTRRHVVLPLLLFVLTCFSTFFAGALPYAGGVVAPLMAETLPSGAALLAFFKGGFAYSVPLMLILGCHEAGHFLQARRYGVRASLPFFIPMPISPIGTFGAVIGMEANMGNRRALFDIGITGPLAGLVPTIIFCVIGLQLSNVEVLPKDGSVFLLGEPILFKLIAWLTFGPLAEGQDIVLHPMAFAGWVGLLITALNLIPIGQLDGGHVLYALLRSKAQQIASLLLVAAVAAVIVFGYWGWTLMLILLMLIGPKHPPTAGDHVPLGIVRIVLGWLTLAFIPIGFTPMPFVFGQ